MNSKKLITSVLTLSMLASTVVPAFAAEPNKVTDPLPNQGYSSVTLEVKDTSGGGGGDTKPDNPDTPPVVDPTDIIIATVPVELPIIMDLEGNVTVPTDAKIINHVTDKGIKVTEINATLESGWSTADFTDDFTTKADGTKELGLSFRNDAMDTTGTFSLAADNWNIAANDSLPLNMAAKLPKQTETAKAKIATIGFTIDWADTEPEEPAEPIYQDFEITPENRHMIGFTGEENEDLVIPSEFEADGVYYKVTSIGTDAFRYCNDLQSVVIPDSVTEICHAAFASSGLTSVTIQGGVTSIGSSAFFKCKGLTSVTLPDSLTTIGDQAFIDCSSLTSISIPDRVTTIGISTFRDCTSLKSITIPDCVTFIGKYAFQNCTSLTSITIPNSVKSIGQSAFYGCTGLTNITIPNSVTSIGNYAFYNVPHITYNGTATGAPWGALSIN